MFSSRTVFSDILRTRLWTYTRVVSTKSIVLSSSKLDNEILISTAPISARTLCTNVNLEYDEPGTQNIRKKDNLTRQIMVRGKAATIFQEELIQNFLTSHDVATPEEWQELVTNIFKSEFGMINSVSVDGKIMDSCAQSEKLNLARSYLTYMKSVKKKFNGAVVTSFIKVCYARRDSLTEQDKTRIKQFTDFLQKRYTVADSIVCEGLVKGLVLQHKVDEALEVIKKNQPVSVLNSATYSAVASCLLADGQFDRGTDFIRESLEKTDTLRDEVYLTWIETYKDNKERLEKLLLMFQCNDIKPTRLMCDHLLVAFQSFSEEQKMVGTYGTVDNRGICSVCNTALAPVELSREEFEDLRAKFLNDVLVGEDVFTNTTPVELDNFFRLVMAKSPFDVVIDGLNVAFMLGTRTSPLTFVNMVQYAVTHFRERDMKVLVIGRQHMRKWPRFLEMLKEREAHYFLTSDLSEDDPYTLYATMYSGLGTNFVTRDLLKPEKFRFQSEKCSSLFKRWQQAHQIFISYISPSGRVYVRSPMNFQMNVQRTKQGGWHIPYHEDGDSEDAYAMHKKWLCLDTVK